MSRRVSSKDFKKSEVLYKTLTSEEKEAKVRIHSTASRFVFASKADLPHVNILKEAKADPDLKDLDFSRNILITDLDSMIQLTTRFELTKIISVL